MCGDPKAFLDEEASKIVYDLTNMPFSCDGSYWLYFLIDIQLIPGGWICDIYLENSAHKFSGHGDPNGAVKMAYSRIDKNWLENGYKEGKVQKEMYDYHFKKMEYWHHFEYNKQLWPNGFTKKRLDEAWKGLIDYKPFWDDILERHGGKDMRPEKMKENESVYDHCMGNMAAMIREHMVEEEIIRRRK